jgi:hypothetical protein
MGGLMESMLLSVRSRDVAWMIVDLSMEIDDHDA